MISREKSVSAQKTKKELEELQKMKENFIAELDTISKSFETEESKLKSQLSIIEKDEESINKLLDEKKR